MATSKQYIFPLIFVLSGLLSYSQISSLELPEKAIQLDSTVRFGKLENGFTYYLKDINNPQGEVIMKMIQKTGRFHEDEDQTEYAHLLEHVGVRDVEKYKDLATVLTLNGIDHRAFTAKLSTSYTLIIPQSDQQKLDLGLTVLEQWAGGIVIDSSRMNMHQGSILGELRPIDAYADDLYNKKGKILLRNTGFPPADNNKSLQSIKNLDINRLKDFYRDWYRPDLQAAIIVGAINPDSLENVLRNKFSRFSIPKVVRGTSRAIDKFKYKLTGENQYEAINDTINSKWRLNVISKRINYNFKYRSKKDYYLSILQNLYESIITKRKDEYTMQYNPPFSEYSTMYYGNGLASSQISIGLMNIELDHDPTFIEKNIIEAVKADEIMHSNFTPEDLEVAKSKLAVTLGEARNSSDLARAYENNFIYGKAAPSEIVSDELRNLLKNVSLLELQKFADSRRNLLENSDFIFINVPESLIPGKHRIEEIIKKVYGSTIPEYRSPFNKLKSIENLTIKSKDLKIKVEENDLGVTTLFFDNGIKVLLKPTKPQTPEFENRIEFLGFQPLRFNGNSNWYNSQVLAHNYASKVGTGYHNHFQIEQFKRDHNMVLNFGTDNRNYLIEGNFDRSNLKDFFNLLFQYIRVPEEDAEAFNYWQEVNRKRLSPFAIKGGSGFFRDKIEKIWNPKIPGIDESTFNSISQEELMKTYKEHFSNFNEYTFIITGDFQAQDLIGEIRPYFTGLPVSGPREGEKIGMWKNEWEKRNDTLFYGGINQSFSEIFLPVEIEPSIKNQVVLDLVNSAFYERLVKVLRLDCYAPGAGGHWINLSDSLYTFQITYNSELGNEGKMFSNSMDEIENLKETGIDEKWLESHTKYAGQKFKSQINFFGYFNFWPEFLKNSLEEGRDYEEYILKYPGIVENFISIDDVNKAINDYIKKDNLQNFLVLPK